MVESTGYAAGRLVVVMVAHGVWPSRALITHPCPYIFTLHGFISIRILATRDYRQLNSSNGNIPHIHSLKISNSETGKLETAQDFTAKSPKSKP